MNDITVIIPTCNHEKIIHSSLEDLFSNHDPDEVIVADGGSKDRTLCLAHEWCQTLNGAKNRAQRINQTAEIARSGILLVLSPEMKLPKNALKKIRGAVMEGAYAGRFLLGFDLIRQANILSNLFGSEDYCFFIRKDLFLKLGGLRGHVPAVELDLFKRLRRITHVVTLKDAVSPFVDVRMDALAFTFFKIKSMIVAFLYDLGIYSPSRTLKGN